MFDTKGRMQLRTNSNRKAVLKWQPTRKSFLINVTEPNAVGTDPLVWTAEVSLGELMIECDINYDDVRSSVLFYATNEEIEVDPSTGWVEDTEAY